MNNEQLISYLSDSISLFMVILYSFLSISLVISSTKLLSNLQLLIKIGQKLTLEYNTFTLKLYRKVFFYHY